MEMSLCLGVLPAIRNCELVDGLPTCVTTMHQNHIRVTLDSGASLCLNYQNGVLGDGLRVIIACVVSWHFWLVERTMTCAVRLCAPGWAPGSDSPPWVGVAASARVFDRALSVAGRGCLGLISSPARQLPPPPLPRPRPPSTIAYHPPVHLTDTLGTQSRLSSALLTLLRHRKVSELPRSARVVRISLDLPPPSLATSLSDSSS